jgi:hypothetical protein
MAEQRRDSPTTPKKGTVISPRDDRTGRRFDRTDYMGVVLGADRVSGSAQVGRRGGPVGE